MINQSTLNKDQSENDDKSKRFDSLIRAYNEKGLFPFSLDNPSLLYSNSITSPSKKISTSKKNFEFSSLKKDFSINNMNYGALSGNKYPEYVYGYPNPPHLLESSEPKDFFNYQNNINKEINLSGQKRIRQKLDNEFEEILLSKKKEIKAQKDKEKQKDEIIKKKEKSPIICTINDKFFDLLVNIYTLEGIEIGDEKMDMNLTEKNNLNKNINNNNQNNVIEKISDFNINQNSNENNEDINDQICCICSKSKCMNNYCRCHKNGNICNKNCRCLGCENTSINIKKEVISPSIQVNEIKNKNNCKCKSSNCFNLYCNCKRRGILCSKDCECSNCKNYKKSLKK